jgi:hypothetical protein
MNLPNIKLISLKDFENQRLLEIKAERNVAEYSWTCASNFIWFLLQKNKEFEMMIYLDADLYFFNDPKILISELENNDVMITEHRYTKKYDQSVTSGKYCVQFMVFKNNSNGLKILDWWRSSCLDWCFDYLDNGRFGDQKYLDDWLTRFNGVYELQHLGGGVAPWNVQQYNFFIKNKKIFGQTKNSENEWPLVFYHFHSFCLISPAKYLAARRYEISKNVNDLINETYFKALQSNIEFVKKFMPNFNFGFKKISIKEKIISKLSHFSFIKTVTKYIKIIKDKIYDKKNKS